MTKEELIRNLKYTMEKHKNDNVPTFGTNISLMCKDILDYLEKEPCDDCVSRKAMLDAITEIDGNINMDIYTNEVREIIENLPPVTPTRKKGKWERFNLEHVDSTMCVCSHCGKICEFIGGELFNFCPSCGAEMESEE